jgi:spoIIIJ-associated protein
VSARTVDEAVARALAQLGLGREDVEVEILHAGSPGRLLGFGAEPARVRVTARAPAGAPLAGEGAAAAGRTVALGSAFPVATIEAMEEPAEALPEVLENEEAEAGVPVAAEPGDAELARIMLAELLNRMGVTGAWIEIVSLAPITLNIRGEDVADLIGRRGEHLRALQFILALMVNKQLHRRLPVIVDVDGYRQRREELLRNLAHRFAGRVRVTGEPMQMEAMPPNERRIIHLALANDPDVTTESIGEGEARRVVIKPRR